jgi:hypothetical protein
MTTTLILVMLVDVFAGKLTGWVIFNVLFWSFFGLQSHRYM